MENKEIEGKIYAFSKDRKSISVNGIWLHSFAVLKDDIKKGINYRIVYTTKKVDDKEFNNIKSMVAIKQDIPEEKNKTETKIDWKVTENRESKEKIASMMTSYVKDIAVAVIVNSKTYTDINLVIDNATKELIKSYKEFREYL